VVKVGFRFCFIFGCGFAALRFLRSNFSLPRDQLTHRNAMPPSTLMPAGVSLADAVAAASNDDDFVFQSFDH